MIKDTEEDRLKTVEFMKEQGLYSPMLSASDMRMAHEVYHRVLDSHKPQVTHVEIKENLSMLYAMLDGEGEVLKDIMQIELYIAMLDNSFLNMCHTVKALSIETRVSPEFGDYLFCSSCGADNLRDTLENIEHLPNCECGKAELYINLHEKPNGQE